MTVTTYMLNVVMPMTNYTLDMTMVKAIVQPPECTLINRYENHAHAPQATSKCT